MQDRNEHKGYVNIPMRINEIEFKYGSKWEQFLEQNVFIHISNAPIIKQEEYKDAVFWGTALHRDIEDDEDVEIELEEIDNNAESADVCEYKAWQAKLTELLVETRKNNTPVARIHKKGGVSVVLLPKDAEKEFKNRLDTEKDFRYCYQNLVPQGKESLTSSDVINLLAIRMLYAIAETEGQTVPEDRILDQYAVFFSKKEGGFQDANISKVKTKENGKPIYEDDVKKSFLTLYVKELILHMDVLSFYQDGEWRDEIGEGYRKKKVDYTFHYGVCKINDNWHLTNSNTNHGLGKKFVRGSKKKAILSVRSVSKIEKNHRNTKMYFADQMIYQFNKQYKDILEIGLKEWVCYQNEDEVSGAEGKKRILEKTLIDTNEIRLQIEKAGGIHFVFRKAEELDEEENADFINDSSIIADKLTSTYKNALYRGITSSKNHIRKVEIKDTSNDKCQYSYKVKYVAPKKIDDNEKEEITTILKKNLATNCFEAEIPKNIEKIKLEMYLSAETDISLELEMAADVVLTTDVDKKENVIKFTYNSGFGVKSENITSSNKLDMNRMNIHIILDKRTNIYKESRYLRVQHCICNKEVEAFNPKAQTILRELGIKAAVVNRDIPIKGDIKTAIYIMHVPKDKKKKIKAYKRYFIYDSSNHDEIIRESTELELYELYPELYLPNTYGDAYVVMINDTLYVIEKTPIVPMGSSLLDEEGNLYPVEQLKSKKREDYISNLPGYVGIIFHEANMELYYSVTENRWFEEMTENGVTRFPNFYKVVNEFQMDDISDELRESLTHSVVKLNSFTVVPSIFKYIKEWANTYGE